MVVVVAVEGGNKKEGVDEVDKGLGEEDNEEAEGMEGNLEEYMVNGEYFSSCCLDAID